MTLFSELRKENRLTKIYWVISAILGSVILTVSSTKLYLIDGASLFTLILLTMVVIFSGLFPVRIFGTHSVITPSEVYVFLIALMFGGAAATCVAALDSFVATCTSSKRWITRIAALTTNATAMYLSSQIFLGLQKSLATLTISNILKHFIALMLFAVVYFLLNSFLMSTHSAIRQGRSIFSSWWDNYAWAGTTYLASGVVAGLIFLGMRDYGMVVLLATAPLVATVFMTFRFYFKQAEERENNHRQRTEAAEARASLAQNHLLEMRLSEERFRSAFDYAAIGMALVSTDGKWMQVNQSIGKILGYADSELLATDFQSLTHPEDLDIVCRSIAQLLSGENTVTQLEHRFLHSAGHEIWVSLNVALIDDSRHAVPRLIFQIQNINDRKWAEERLMHDAFHDALTGLPNRSLFLDHLEMAIARYQRHRDRAFAVLFLDCDRFKVVNDSLGHLAGDELLIEVARRLSANIRLGDTVARLGGDEFTILLEDIHALEEALFLVDRIQKALSIPIRIGSNEVSMTASIGIAFSHNNYAKPEEVLRDADTAMYQAKSHGKAQHTVFDQNMHTVAIRQLQLETDLRHATERQELSLVFQPIVSLQNARLLGFEALLRWRHPELGQISPAEFIPIAEETGMIIEIGQWVMIQACLQLKSWEQLGSRDLIMSINFSGKQLSHATAVSSVLEALSRSQVNPEKLKLEITESVVMDNIELSIHKLDQIRKIGVKLSIDDFGTGYSSLSYLHRLPTDTLKIDRSFVMRMVENKENAEIVKTIVTLGKTLKMDVTAEGVETCEQLRQLQELGVECGQGYLFSRPLEIEAATSLLTQDQPWQAFELLASQIPVAHTFAAIGSN